MAKPKVSRAVHANRGVEAWYRAEMRNLLAVMRGDVESALADSYRDSPPAMLAVVDQAADAEPTAKIKRILEGLALKWVEKFDEWAPRLAVEFVARMRDRSDKALIKSLRDSGWAVKFTMTPAMKDALDAVIAENIGLIKSIPVKYLQQVEGAVMRSYAAGRDLFAMRKEIESIYPISSKRAAFIARDQTNKANATVIRARQLSLGITEAIWMHSHAGKVPRPDHVAAHGKRYKIAEGCKISGEYIQPGEEINCRCVSRAVLPI